MKILFLTRLFWSHVGGIEKHIDEISKILVKRGHLVSVMTTRHNAELRTHEPVHGYNIIRFDQPNIKYLGLIYTWFWIVKNINLFIKSDIVHIHDVFIWYWPLRVLLPFKKVFITYHGQWGKYPIPYVDILQKKIGRYFSNGVISIGKYIDKYYGIKSDIISYGGVNLPNNKVKKDNNLLLYVGRLDSNTSLPKILEFIHNYHTTVYGSYVKVIFCGDGELKDECKRYGKVLGFVDPSPYYEKAKFVFASGYLTILEAIANKCLVFTTYGHNLQKDYYQLTHFRDFMILCEDERELGENFAYYNRYIKKTEAIINKGYKWVMDQSWQKMADNYYKLWKI